MFIAPTSVNQFIHNYAIRDIMSKEQVERVTRVEPYREFKPQSVPAPTRLLGEGMGRLIDLMA